MGQRLGFFALRLLRGGAAAGAGASWKAGDWYNARLTAARRRAANLV